MNKKLGTLLVLAVTTVLLTLLFSGNQSVLVVLSVMIVLVSMLLVIGGTPDLLPDVLKTILREIRHIIRP